MKSSPLTPRGARDAAVVVGFALTSFALSAFIGVAAWGPPEAPPPEERIAAVAGIACPRTADIADPRAWQAAIDEDLQEAATNLQAEGLESTLRELEDVQTEICALIRQNPQRGLAWAQLLSASPQAAADPVVRQAMLTLSQDLGRLEVDALRARVNFCAPRWAVLTPAERRLFLADVRNLAQVPVGNYYIAQLASLGFMGEAEMVAAIRAVVAQVQPAYLSTFDAYSAMTGKRAR